MDCRLKLLIELPSIELSSGMVCRDDCTSLTWSVGVKAVLSCVLCRLTGRRVSIRDLVLVPW